MAAITPTVSPGSYLQAQDVGFTFGADVVNVAMTVNKAAPSVSKYIAYDTLTPPNPFIAVTEDGRGRVVYDGGFPKFYSDDNEGTYASFATLKPAGKYLFNALKYIANSTKLANGNNKVLILGDAVESSYYAVKSTRGGTGGFFDMFTNVCRLAGFVPTFKDTSDYAGGYLNPTLSELENYCCILVVSSMRVDVAYITAAAVSDIVTYRENGNGMFLISDDGDGVKTAEQMNASHSGYGFYRMVNEIAVKFGAFFTGNFDRSPVNVGFLRANYGDHPLYAGLTDAEYFPAGGSESKVIVTESVLTPPDVVAPVHLDTAGLNTINVLVLMKDGTIQTARYVYNIQGSEFLFLRSSKVSFADADMEENKGTVWADASGKMIMAVRIDATNLGTVWGEIVIGGKRVGEVSFADGVYKEFWYSGSAANTPVYTDQEAEVNIVVPFSYSKKAKVFRDKSGSTTAVSMAGTLASVRDWAGMTDVSKHPYSKFRWANAILNKVNPFVVASVRPSVSSSFGHNLTYLRAFMNERLQTSANLTGRFYATTALTKAAIASTPIAPGMIFIDAQTQTVWGYKGGAYVLLEGLSPYDIYGYNRTIVSQIDGKNYTLHDTGVIQIWP